MEIERDRERSSLGFTTISHTGISHTQKNIIEINSMCVSIGSRGRSFETLKNSLRNTR